MTTDGTEIHTEAPKDGLDNPWYVLVVMVLLFTAGVLLGLALG